METGTATQFWSFVYYPRSLTVTSMGTGFFFVSWCILCAVFRGTDTCYQSSQSQWGHWSMGRWRAVLFLWAMESGAMAFPVASGPQLGLYQHYTWVLSPWLLSLCCSLLSTGLFLQTTFHVDHLLALRHFCIFSASFGKKLVIIPRNKNSSLSLQVLPGYVSVQQKVQDVRKVLPTNLYWRPSNRLKTGIKSLGHVLFCSWSQPVGRYPAPFHSEWVVCLKLCLGRPFSSPLHNPVRPFLVHVSW